MADDKQEPVQTNDAPALNIDWFLRDIVRMINTSTLELGITLQMGGFIVSGTLISGRTYFEKLGDAMAQAFPNAPDTADALKSYFSRPAAAYLIRGEGEDEDAEQDRPTKTSFIHLKDARFFHNGGKPIPTDNGVLWRGKLADVSGYVMGTVSSS